MGRIARWVEDFCETMKATLLNKWLWIIIGGMCAVVVIPLMVLWVLMIVPPWLSATITILRLIGWGIASGYKEYLLYKRKSEQARSKGEEFNAATYDEYVEKQKRYRARS
ncbi:MAG: hypothetical protein QXM22_03995 [Candidatus Bathyarchaeia archaeon]